MFDFKNTDVMLDNMTVRVEKHGEEPMPAVSLKMSVEMPNSILDKLEEGLLEALYKRTENKPQIEIGGIDDLFPDLKFNRIKPIQLDNEYENCRLLVVNQIDTKENDHIIPKCSLKSFKVELKDRGQVILHFTVNCCPTKEAVGYFYEQQQHNCFLTLVQPEPAQLDDLVDGMDGDATEHDQAA